MGNDLINKSVIKRLPFRLIVDASVTIYFTENANVCWKFLKIQQTGKQIYAFIGHLTITNHIDGLVQACNNSIINALELLQSCTKSSISN